jgi:phosphopantothenoylcysteine decarboxylase/phosphopantothenate--cysteine ligase
VANDVTQPGAGFGTSTNRVTLVDGESAEELPLMDKGAVARAVLDRIEIIREAPRA